MQHCAIGCATPPPAPTALLCHYRAIVIEQRRQCEERLTSTKAFLYSKSETCQNDAHRNGTCETRLSSPEVMANNERVLYAQHADCSCWRAAVIMIRLLHTSSVVRADECIGHAGVQMG
jgi:hypothetical protein